MAKPLWQHVETLTRKVFERHGFAFRDVLVHWPEIVGPEYAEATRPHKIVWPRSGKTDDRGLKQGGTLILLAGPFQMLTMQHATSQILERVNSFFGYAAIGKIKVVPDHTPVRPPETGKTTEPLPVAAVQAVEASLARIEDPSLQDALRRLGQGMLRQQKGSTKQ